MRNEKGDNRLVKFTLLVLLLTILAMCLVFGTYAKYTTTFSGNDSAVVAKWVVSDGGALANLDIFDVSKIYDTEGTDYANGVDDTDVINGTDNGIIAPGTWGFFTYNLSNDSDVTATYEIDYTVDEKGVYLLWSVDGGTTWTDDLADVTATTLNVGEDVDVTVHWKWSFEADTTAAGQTDAADTALGMAAQPASPTMAIKATFTQVD